VHDPSTGVPRAVGAGRHLSGAPEPDTDGHARGRHPAVGAGPAAGGARRRRPGDGRGAAAKRLGSVPSVTHCQLLRQLVLLRGHFPGGSRHRAAAQRKQLEPEPQHLAVGERGPLHRLPPRRREPGGAGEPDRRGGIVRGCAVPAGTRHDEPVSRRARRPAAGGGTGEQRPESRGAAQDVGGQAPCRLGHPVGFPPFAGDAGERPAGADPGANRTGDRRGGTGPADRRDRTGPGGRRLGVLPGDPSAGHRRASD
jgi:hypothetical protein